MYVYITLMTYIVYQRSAIVGDNIHIDTHNLSIPTHTTYK